MFQSSLLLLFAPFTIYTLSQAAICTPAPGLLPTVSDCTDLLEAISWLSRMPGENNMKAWGRRLPTTLDTQKVPKVYWISGRGPTTCAVHVDVDSYDLWAVDDFRLADVASAGEEVVAQCLSAKSKVGLAYPAGADGLVHAKVVRTDSPFGLESFNQSDVQRFALPGTVEALQAATVDPAMLILLGFHPLSNVTANMLRVD
ncbi:hypothetical protein HO173_006474 [Letharia columbiana]|uniref:Uncharacterized protein n=1 Tax=Letharia columbiana TaxID=112416 RepID=A0A8H6FV58_9LECA|nr:uncharacterized protein HO173_006474 [Letharia columbiana]KAF6235280.1 hypothetical protein HO173_006474 [Letharia columbiana]